MSVRLSRGQDFGIVGRGIEIKLTPISYSYCNVKKFGEAIIMAEGVIAALVALAGVGLSVTASIFVSIRQSRLEARKLRSEYLHLYAGKLFDRRMTGYPLILESIVPAIQKINLKQPISTDEVEKLADQLFNWNIQHSFLLSARSEQVMHGLYIDLKSMTNEETNTLVNNQDLLIQLKGKLLKFYLALKGDLGIYALVSPSIITEFEAPASMKDVTKLSEISEKEQWK